MKDVPITNETLTAILGAIDEGIHAVDEKGYTIFYNHVAARLDGLTEEEVLGKHLLEVFPSLDVETSTILQVIESKKPIYHEHQQYTNLKGKQVITLNTTLPIWVEGKFVGAVEVAKDISTVKELTEKLIDLQTQVVQHQQVPEKAKAKAEPGDEGKLYTFSDIISQNKVIEQIKKLGAKAAKTTSPILIMGETGTGKELVVQSIHNASPRGKAPFIAQNCAALPATLLEGILFGTVKGSFTGAENRPGLFELAHGGTLFLDEINSMPLELQAKLLRVIQEGRVRRVGASKEIAVDVRLIAALNEDPKEAIKENRLRSDLYYRLNVVSFRLPPLRERKGDIALLVQHFIQKFNGRFGKGVMKVHPEVSCVLMEHDWPGNVRELEHTIEAAMNVVEGDQIGVLDLPLNFQQIETPSQEVLYPISDEDLSLRDALKQVEEQMIQTAMVKADGNIMQAAKRLGIPRQTLQYKLSKLDS